MRSRSKNCDWNTVIFRSSILFGCWMSQDIEISRDSWGACSCFSGVTLMQDWDPTKFPCSCRRRLKLSSAITPSHSHPGAGPIKLVANLESITRSLVTQAMRLATSATWLDTLVMRLAGPFIWLDPLLIRFKPRRLLQMFVIHWLHSFLGCRAKCKTGKKLMSLCFIGC